MSDGMPMNMFWSLVAFLVIAGIGGFVGFVFFYWLVVIPERVLGSH